jgi:hypothetical protein
MWEILAPDLVINNGRIYTVDKAFSKAEAVAVKHDKIVAVGTSQEVKKLIGKYTKTLDLKGHTMLPGVVDSHAHFAEFGLRRPPLVLDLTWPNVDSIAGNVSLVAERVKMVAPGEWIQGSGWTSGYLKEIRQDPKRLPTKEDLDAVSPDNPVCLMNRGGHDAWVNSKAMALAGITRDTADLVGGIIVREPATGEPSGILKETAIGLVSGLIPPWTEKQRKDGILAAMDTYSSQGVTTCNDAGGFIGGNAETLRFYGEAYREGTFKVRIMPQLCLAGWGGTTSLAMSQEFMKYVGTNTGFGNNWLKIAGIKLFADGITTGGTGFVTEPYPDGTYGGLVTEGNTPEKQIQSLKDTIIYCHKHGFQLGIHASGDRTCEVAVDAMIQALKEYPWDARHFLIHADSLRPDTARLMSKYDIGVASQAAVKVAVAEKDAVTMGEARASATFPQRMTIDAGVHLSNSSDAPVTWPSWLKGVKAAVLRESLLTGKQWGPDQCITVEEAIRSYTNEGAWLLHMENLLGSIEAGKLADFCIIDEDILAIDPHGIGEVTNLMTIVGGKIVYNAQPDYLYLK